MLRHHPHGTRAHFRRVCLRCLPRFHRSILSRVGASGKPGAVQRLRVTAVGERLFHQVVEGVVETVEHEFALLRFATLSQYFWAIAAIRCPVCSAMSANAKFRSLEPVREAAERG
jgi:hypothetical protein